MRATIWLLGVTAVVIALIVGRSGLVGPSKRSIVHMRYAGRELSIPVEYLSEPASLDLLDEPSSLMLHAYLPDFTATPTRPEVENGGSRQKIEIEVEKRQYSLNIPFADLAAYRIVNVPFHDAYSLRAFRAERPEWLRKGSFSNPREVYFQQHDQIVTVLIMCEPGWPSPPCHHQFADSDLMYNLTYHLSNLSDWMRIQTAAKAFIQRLQVGQ